MYCINGIIKLLNPRIGVPHFRRALNNYSYRPIEEDDCVRIFSLGPGRPGDPLQGKLETVTMDTIGRYEAVSYVWADSGPPNCKWEILLRDGDAEHLLELKTGSMYVALQRLRLLDEERRIWVDQICINQDNLEERSRQVQFMNRIFKNSQRVLVWLGLDEEKEAGSAFASIRTLDEMFRDQASNTKSNAQFIKDLEQQVEKHQKGLHSLTKRKWFTRGWVVQEIGTKAPATLFWGDAEIDWQRLYSVCERLADYHHLRKTFDIRTSSIKFFFQRFIEPDKSSFHANRFNFLYELHRARGLNFTDDRDRIFAFLGHYSLQPAHCPNRELASIEANYEITVEQLYRDIARRALQGGQGDSALIALAAVQHTHKSLISNHREGMVDQPRLPSWVPDWRNFQGFILSEPINPHRAHGVSVPNLEISEDTNILRIHGLKVDSIEACSRVLLDKEFYRVKGDDNLDTTVEYLWHQICQKDRFELDDLYLNGDKEFFAFMQTLSNGCVQAAGREGKTYVDINDNVWLGQAAEYLVKTLGESEAISPILRSLGKEAKVNTVKNEFGRLANGASKNRRFARTSKGYYVLGPAVMEKDDIICVLFGGKMPFCLRPLGEERYMLVGECYVHGLMKGEAMDMMVKGEFIEEIFELV
ncbi:HET-domain-containing protein [Annulohypoxylon moriforme]|nr:HET-domain-containing protein [Annulohypoxylon moriforme]